MNELEKIISKLGYQLTEMQTEMTAVCQAGKSAVLLSPTGSGKTLAYLLPLCTKLNPASGCVQAVVVVPSRELAQQSEAVFKMLDTQLRAVCCHGGRPAMEEYRKLQEVKPHLVFCTPGRLNDHLDKENILGGTVTTLVIDEFDKCLELGFLADMEKIISRLHFVNQFILTSATDAAQIPDFMQRFASCSPAGAARLDYLNSQAALRSRQKYHVVHSPRKDKLETLAHLLSGPASGLSICFVAHRESADRVGSYLKECGFFAEVYHGGMEQEQRERALSKFRSGCSNVLVSTDLAARGLDIPEVQSVIHYHPTASADAFTHRNGRTARWNLEGTVYILKSDGEELPDFMTSEADELDVESTPIAPKKPQWCALYIGRGKKDKLSRMDIVGFLCKKGGLRGEEIGRIELSGHFACVAVARSKTKAVLQAVAGEKIKGMKTLVELMRR